MDDRIRTLTARREFGAALAQIEADIAALPRVRAAILCELGRSAEALDVLLRASAEGSPDLKLLSQMLVTSLHVDIDCAKRARLHRVAMDLPGVTDQLPPQEWRGRKIRIGYLSGAFCDSPEFYFLAPLFRHHDRAAFEILAYSTGPVRDEQTDWFAERSDRFVDLATTGDTEAVDRVRLDRLDVLVDCAGHFGGGRPGIFARRAAPIQVSFPLYPSTTGVPAMDFRIADRWTDPADSAGDFYSESLIYLDSGCFGYEPPLSPPATPLPRDRNGFVMFGVFARPAKWNEETLTRFARIVARVPGSRIVFHHVFNGPGSVEDAITAPVREIFERHDVAPDRVSFQGQLPLGDHLDLLATADVALDTFPYNGMTTTCKCLWMGVPVVTLAGECHVSRVGVSILQRIGLSDWIAASPEEFEEIAIHAAQDPRLGELRRGLRERMAASRLIDGPAFARGLESGYRAMLTGAY